jgi:hypothetical protein
MSTASNIWPRYSFVQDSSAGSYTDTYPDPKLCLPLSSWSNLQCQALIDATGPLSLLAAVPGATVQVYLTPVDIDFPCSYDIQQRGIYPGFTHTHYPVISIFGLTYDTGPTAYSAWLCFDLPSDSGDMDDTTLSNNTIAVPVGSCFKFALVWDVYNSGLLIYRFYYGCTNSFVRMPAGNVYSSVLRYANADNAFDFHYTGTNNYGYGDTEDFQNTIELPIYLRDPKMTNDQKVYTRSDGSIMKIYERKEEVYELETDQMPYTWHKALDIALSHDSVAITNANASSFDPLNTATQFVKKDAYEIEYNKAPYSSFGKGKCKLSNADAVNLINNNCA